MEPQKYISDYRLNERHYGALQGYVKDQVERGVYGHDSRLVQAWRRSWYAVPPLLEDGDPRRIQEVKRYQHYCGGGENVPRGESLEMVANHRIRPFLDSVLHPTLMEASEYRRKTRMQRRDKMRHRRTSGYESQYQSEEEQEDRMMRTTTNVGGCGLVVAHANSLRALIGVLCGVERDEALLKQLEAMKIPTGVPLVMRYRQLDDGTYEACPLPEIMTTATIGTAGSSGEMKSPIIMGSTTCLPVWPLSCLPKSYNSSYNHGIEEEMQEVKGRGKYASRKIRIDVI